MILKAHCVLSGGRFEPVTPGLLRIQEDRIAQLGSDLSVEGEATLDFAGLAPAGFRAVIAPAFIDAHCHLELSLLARRIRYPGSFVGWIGKLVLRKPKRLGTQLRAVTHGVRQHLAAGTATVADISANGRSWQALIDLPIRKIAFAETLGRGPRARTALAELPEKIHAMPPDGGLFLRGVSPHAPYSTDPQLYRLALELARMENLRLTSHLAEDPSELRFLDSASGPWITILKAVGAWDKAIRPTGQTPIQWAANLGLLDFPALLAHVNYATDADLQRLAAGCASVAYCPLAHRYFNHPPHRYRDMLEAGINVALGTDSAAAGSPLSILAQAQAVHQLGGLPPSAVLAMATIRAARALQLDHVVGSIDPGKSADLAVLAVNDNPDPLAAILDPTARVLATFVAGHLVHRSPDVAAP